MLDFYHQPVDGRVTRGEPGEGAPEINRALKVRRPLAPRLRMDEIKTRRCPWRFQYSSRFGEERGRKLGERIAFRAPCAEETPDETSLLSGDAHALAICGIEPAQCVP